jgi:hypothetical protein
MTNWDSPAVLLSEYCASFIHAKVLSSETYLYASVGYVNIVYTLFGLYTWAHLVLTRTRNFFICDPYCP